MNIRIAEARDFTVISGHDRHISPAELENSIRLGRAAVAEEDGVLLGWLRWNLFWDNTPFLNLIYLPEPHRGKGHGKTMMDWWEKQMAAQGYDAVMTSTASDEYAQHFYIRLGYTAMGGFTPFGESYELIFGKRL